MKSKKAVILLGSGFAIPFGGPSSKELLDYLEKEPFTDEKVDFSNAIYESKDPKPLFFHNDLI